MFSRNCVKMVCTFVNNSLATFCGLLYITAFVSNVECGAVSV